MTAIFSFFFIQIFCLTIYSLMNSLVMNHIFILHNSFLLFNFHPYSLLFHVNIHFLVRLCSVLHLVVLGGNLCLLYFYMLAFVASCCRMSKLFFCCFDWIFVLHFLTTVGLELALLFLGKLQKADWLKHCLHLSA